MTNELTKPRPSTRLSRERQISESPLASPTPAPSRPGMSSKAYDDTFRWMGVQANKDKGLKGAVKHLQEGLPNLVPPQVWHPPDGTEPLLFPSATPPQCWTGVCGCAT